MIAFFVIAVVFAAFMVYRTIRGQQPHVVKTVNATGMAAKLQGMQAAKNYKSGQAPGAGNSKAAGVLFGVR